MRIKNYVFSFLSLFSVGALAQSVNMANGSTTTCSATFFDSGGPGGNYSNNENLTHTFFPATPGTAIEITFLSYASGSTDYLTIYNGPDNTYPIVVSGSGPMNIPPITSSDASGALTIVFTSNASGTSAGWDASVACCDSPQYWYQDSDGDGFGYNYMPAFCCTAPAGYVANNSDCYDAAIMYEDLDGDGFGSTVITGCGSLNNIDCDDLAWTYQDNDADGYGDPNALSACGSTNNTDCNDSDAAIGSGSMYTWYNDSDGDGFGNLWFNTVACTAPVGYVNDSSDCDDASLMYADLDGDGFGAPGVLVSCGVYNNLDCNDALTTYADTDGDGYGDPNVSMPCGIADNTDCDDTDAAVGSGSIVYYYADSDGDGFGDPASSFGSCTPLAGFVLNDDDCDDSSVLYADLDGDGYGDPAAEVACGVYDNTDCDDNLLTYDDFDGDGFGNPNLNVACGIADNTDCDDGDALVGSGTMAAYFHDVDADGYGVPTTIFWSCTPVLGMVTDSTDCDDFNDNVNPGATEIIGNGIDENCDGFDASDVGIEEPSSNSISFTMYPNPARDVVNLAWSGFSGDLVLITILNTNGQVIYTTSEAMSKNQTEIDLSSVAPGMYLVQLIGSDNTKTQLLVVE